MTGRVGRPGARDAALTAFAMAGAAAFAWGLADARAWLLMLAFPAAAAFPITAIPMKLSRAVERTAWVALGLLAAAVFYWLTSPEGQSQPAPTFPLAAASAAPLLSALFLTGRSVWPPHRGLVPAVLVTAVVGASRARSERPMDAVVVVVIVSAVLVLLTEQGPGPASAWRRRLPRLVAFAAFAGGLAAGLAWFLPWAQPLVIQAAARAAFPEATSGFSPEASLGATGELKLSERVVMRVWSGRRRRLRGWVGTRFDGAVWSAPSGPVRDVAVSPATLPVLAAVPGDTFRVEPPGSPLPPDAPLEALRIQVVGSIPGYILAPAGAVWVRVVAPGHSLGVDAAGILRGTLLPDTDYGVLTGATEADPSPGADSLALPPDTDPRLVELARKLKAGTATTEERVDRTRQYLQTHLGYSLKIGELRSKQPVAEFVFEKKRGWCTYFATAAAVLLRLQDVPTRLVRGFQLRDRLFRAGHYVVRDADAHAWIEVWLPGQGWVEEDPTPQLAYDEAHGGPSWYQGALESLRAFPGWLRGVDWKAVPGRLWARIAALGPSLGGTSLVAGALLVTGCLAWVARRLQAARESRRVLAAACDPGVELAPLLARLDNAWRQHGVPRPPSRAPLEHVAGIPAGRLPAPLVEVSREIVEQYYRSRFAGEPVGADEVRALEAAFEARSRG